MAAILQKTCSNVEAVICVLIQISPKYVHRGPVANNNGSGNGLVKSGSMEYQRGQNPIIMDLHNSIMDLHNSIMDLHNSIMKIHNSIMDLHNWIMDLHNSIMKIHS